MASRVRRKRKGEKTEGKKPRVASRRADRRRSWRPIDPASFRRQDGRGVDP